MAVFGFVLSCVLFFWSVSCGFQNHKYQFTEGVPLLVNHVGPYQNPSETYDYYKLPFCRPPPGVQHRYHNVIFPS
jgi:hypothetical protein